MAPTNYPIVQGPVQQVDAAYVQFYPDMRLSLYHGSCAPYPFPGCLPVLSRLLLYLRPRSFSTSVSLSRSHPPVLQSLRSPADLIIPSRLDSSDRLHPPSHIYPALPANPLAGPVEIQHQANIPNPGHLLQNVVVGDGPVIQVVGFANPPPQGTSPLRRSLYGFGLGLGN